ncbi:hypothetical protein AJ80_01616 [Polytolypa hystricis UAMH7299]|uniref:RNA-dependent RNA polymerase n=1 Tax=Polytolypa hystricis (strain UAMH7299) TaxID=1447883 RepID=A0A2B7YZT6_POLH7|nr:hypothetical protein AJ80_01616 [Polytolypa hystricis UAMH7299]
MPQAPGLGGSTIRPSLPSHGSATLGQINMRFSPPSATPGLNLGSSSHITPAWTTWDSLSVVVVGLPPSVNTYTIWSNFQKHGSIEVIELYENAKGVREGKCKVRFKPPPWSEFWTHGRFDLELPDGSDVLVAVQVDVRKPLNFITSPVNPKVTYPRSINMKLTSMDFGTMVEEKTFLPLRTINAETQGALNYAVDLKRREVNVYFNVLKPAKPRPDQKPGGIQHALRLRIPFVEMTTVYQVKDGENVTFLIPLANPPVYHRKLNNLESTFSDTDNVWKEIDAWYRQIDIARVQEEMDRLSANLRKTNSLINIARWTTFRITFDKTDIDKKNNFRTMCSVFKDFNIDIKEVTDVTMLEESHDAPMIWQWIDPPSPHPSKPTSSLYDLAETEYVHLPFVIRYQLEVCLSHGFLNEYTMDKEFATKLIELGEKKAKDLLEYVATEKKVYFDPMKIFDLPFVKGATNARIPKYCCYMRTAQITPTTIYYNTPSVDISNRVIRHYIEYADRFLRVRFTDEKKQGRINSTHNKCNDEVFTRIKRAMSNGITIGDRHYDFLAFGNSQFREHGAYFFAGVSNLTSANIRAWMGHFNDIRVIAKNAARLGQCFSTTRAVTGCPVQLREITDIKHNDYTFSDGVGRISKFLAQMIMTEFKIKTPSGEPPSVYQFRLGGCKGILAVSANALRQEIHIRPSQYKFAAKHNGLEIIRHSHFSMSTLNRQLIAVLSTLGVTDKVFIDKLRTMLANLDLAMNNDKKAIHLLQKYVDPNQMTLVLSDMVLDGFQKSKEPFVTSLLELWRAWQIKYLKEKAKIVIEKGACVLGCLDETNTLKGHITQPKVPEDAPLEEKLKRLPEIFIQIPRSDDPASGKYEVIEGLCILARNPSLHPGDIRVVKAVNVPALHHLKDVVVLPQSGDRDVASMCSGGDLDGDDYVVFWDQDLLPRDWFRDPMDYSAPEPLTLSREVTVNDITTFFVQYIKNDRLPQIAHAHLAFADWFDNGVENEKCIRLAELHSAAVDYNKTGIAAMMTRDLIPRKWPHFMEKKHKPKEAQYVSEKILGKLYDIVKRVDFRPNLQEPFDDRILNSGVEVSDELMKTAMELKEQYDADMRRIMAQHDIKTEFEVWSTFVLSHANMSKDYKFHEELGGISTALREKFRLACYEKAGGRDFKSIAPLAVAMYKVTNQQVKAAWAAGLPPASIDDESSGEFRSENPAKLPLISFPWVLQQVLGKIANGHFDTAVFSGTVPSATSPHHQREKARKSKKDELDGLDAPHDIQTAEGIQHSGELLELFHDGDLLGDDPFSGLGEAFENTNISEKENQKDVVSAPGGVPPKLPALLIDFDFDFGSDTKVDRTPLSPTATSPNIPQTASPAYIPVVVDLLAFGDEYLPSDRNGGSLVSNIQSVATALPPSKPHRKPRLNGGNTPPSWPKVLHPGSTRSTTPSVPPSTIQNDDVETRVEVEGEVKPSAVDDLEMLLAL